MIPDEPVADDTISLRQKPHRSIVNHSDDIQSIGCVLFGIATIAFGLVSAFLLTWGIAWAHNSREGGGIATFVTCGAIYMIGSLICFRIRTSGKAMLLPGIILNAIGAYVWVPGMSSLNEGSWVFFIPGLALLGCWIALIFRRPAAPNCKTPDSPTSHN